MKAQNVPRCIMLPPLGRPCWMPQNPVGADLLYLSWGVRWMGDHPIPLAMHQGWVYAVILKGTPVLCLKNNQHPTRSGDVFIIDPDCAFGWQDQPKQSSRIMTWLWHNPPTHSMLIPQNGDCKRMHVDEPQLRQLVAIHQHCQRNVGVIGETAQLLLQRDRLDLDICLAWTLSDPEPQNQQVQMDMALCFLRENLSIKHPVKELCSHLNVTPAALRNLFQQSCGRGPHAIALEIRMNHARERLARSNASVKEVAGELGYCHANDLSRAYKNYFGTAVRSTHVPS